MKTCDLCGYQGEDVSLAEIPNINQEWINYICVCDNVKECNQRVNKARRKDMDDDIYGFLVNITILPFKIHDIFLKHGIDLFKDDNAPELKEMLKEVNQVAKEAENFILNYSNIERLNEDNDTAIL